LCRDMLRFADADEAEAVYSMVSLTQAAHKQGDWHAAAAHIKGPVIEVRHLAHSKAHMHAAAVSRFVPPTTTAQAQPCCGCPVAETCGAPGCCVSHAGS
jgi:hypothetical protein